MRCALLHGFAGDPSVWDDVIAAWSPGERPLSVALPGHGGDDDVHATWNDNLAAVGRAVAGCDVVVGYSLGARTALGLVATGRCARAVLIGVNPGLADNERPARRARDAGWAAVLRRDGVAAFDDAWTAQPLFASQALAPADRRDRRRARRLALDPEQLARSLEIMGLAEMPDYRSAFTTFGKQLSLITGANDATFVAIAAALPAASCETIPDCGHDPTLEQPAAIAAAIARAIERTGTGGDGTHT